MTNINPDPFAMIVFTIGTILGIFTMAFIFSWSMRHKQYDTKRGLLVFIFGTIFIFIIGGQIQESLFTLSIFGISFTVLYLLTKKVQESSIITFVGIIFFNGFQLGQRAGTEGMFGPTFDLESYVRPRMLILLSSVAVSSMVMYTYFRSVDRSAKGSMIGVFIVSILFILELFAYFKFGFNLTLFMSDAPFWIYGPFVYISPILIGFSVMKLTGEL